MGLLDYLYGRRDTGQPLLDDASGVDSVGNPLFVDPRDAAEGKRRFTEALATMPSVQAVKEAVTAPVDAYQGKFDPLSEEGTARALGMAGLAMTGGIAGAPKGAIGSGPARRAAELPMDEASRLARAKELGYTREAFHETRPENVDSLLSGGFDLARRGAGYNDSEMPVGVFTKSHDRRIGLGGQEPAQMPLLIREGNQVAFPDRESLAAFLSRDDAYRTMAEQHKALDAKYGKVVDDLWDHQDNARSADPEKHAVIDAKINQTLEEWKQASDALSAQMRDRSTGLLKSQGYDSLRVGHDPGFMKGTTDTTVVLDPANVRHRNAAFDPANEGKSMLLGGLAGLAALPPLLSSLRPQRPDKASQ